MNNLNDELQMFTGRLYNNRISHILGSSPRIYLTYFDFMTSNGEVITVQRQRNSRSILGEEYDNITFRGYLTTNRNNEPMIVMVE